MKLDAKTELEKRGVVLSEILEDYEFYLKKARTSKSFDLSTIPDSFLTYEMHLAGVSSDGWWLQYVPKRFVDEEMVKNAVKASKPAIKYAPAHLLNKELCLWAVSLSRPAPLSDIPTPFRNDPDVAALALKTNPYNLMHSLPEFHTYEAVKRLCPSDIRKLLPFIRPDLLNEELFLKMLYQDGSDLQYVPAEYQTAKLIAVALEQDPYAKQYIKVKRLMVDALEEALDE